MYRNHVILIGYLARDAEPRGANDDNRYTVLTVVTKTSWRDRAGDWKSHSEYHRCIAWGLRFADVAALKRGSHLQVEGELRSRDLQKDGITQKVFEIRVSTIVHLRKAWTQTESTADPESGEAQS